MNERKKIKYNTIIFLIVITCLILLTVNFNIITTVRSSLINLAVTNIENNVSIAGFKILTTYLGICYGVCSSLFIIYLTTTNCVRINENKKFETETKPNIEQILDVYKNENKIEKTTEKKLLKQTYTIEDFKKEKEKLESNLNEVVELKEKQKVLD